MRKPDILSTPVFFLLALAVSVSVCATESFALAFREQQQLFLWNWAYVRDILFNVGGFARLVALFLVQFFHFRLLAILIPAFVCALIPALLYHSTRRRSYASMMLCLTVTFPIVALAGHNQLHFDIFIAFLLAALFFDIYSRTIRHKAVLSVILTATLWLLAGPVAFPFALMLSLSDIAKRRFSLPAALPLAVSLILPLIHNLTGCSPGIQLLPYFHYEISGSMPAFIIIAWFSLPAVVLFSEFFPATADLAHNVASAAICILAGCLSILFRPQETPQQRAIYKYEFYLNCGRYAELELEAAKHINRYIDSEYRNLASAMQGRLLDDLFKVKQNSPQSLIYCPDDHSALTVLARTLYEAGDYAAAQNIASNALQSFCGFSPSMLILLERIEMLRGNEKVAAKYASLLGRSLLYRKTAARILAGEEHSATESANFDCPEAFVINPVPYNEIVMLADNNPLNVNTVEYALAIMLLAKDFNGIYRFVDRHYASLGRLARPVQEALVFFSDYYSSTSKEYALAHGLGQEQYAEYSGIDLEWCRHHGVSEEVIRNFVGFKNAYASSGGNAPERFSRTFWYYLLFVKI